ncbi:MAG: hypothetical protein WDM96_04220 [Lacunisphaera sp.]
MDRIAGRIFSSPIEEFHLASAESANSCESRPSPMLCLGISERVWRGICRPQRCNRARGLPAGEPAHEVKAATAERGEAGTAEFGNPAFQLRDQPGMFGYMS